jgi:osmotically-inducible protein OsmY
MRNNADLQKDVQDAIKWEPLLHAAEVGVTVDNGVVTLTGSVNSYAKKIEAENATKNVSGVKAIVEKIDVKYPNSFAKKDDNEIATDVLNAMRWDAMVPHEDLKVKVENGWVNLDGELHWNFQKEAAKNSIKNLTGVMGVINNIKIQPTTKDTIEKKDVEQGFKRSWTLDSDNINVNVDGRKVTLNGTVGSIYQKEEAGRIAWNTPGIWDLDNLLKVHYAF